MKSSEPVSSFVQYVRFVGHTTGQVKALSGFKKGHHSVPDAVTSTTASFLAKLCASELRTEAEYFFQRSRSILAYKRKDLALDVASPSAVLTAKDFTFELGYALQPDDAASYVVSRTLHSLHSSDFARTAECNNVFDGLFSELAFVLTKGAQVEAVIDAVEGLESEDGLVVDYPSDYRHCILSVPGVSAEVRFEGAELAMVFPRSGSPGELMEAFLVVREAFSLTKQPVLAGLIG